MAREKETNLHDPTPNDYLRDIGVYMLDVDRLQYHYTNNQIIFDAAWEWKHWNTRGSLSRSSYKGASGLAAVEALGSQLDLPWFCAITFTKPPTSEENPDLEHCLIDGSPMFFVIPGNERARKSIARFGKAIQLASYDPWMTARQLARFSRFLAGKSIRDEKTVEHLPDNYFRYPLRCSIDWLSFSLDKPQSLLSDGPAIPVAPQPLLRVV